MRPIDLHLVFNDTADTLKTFDGNGKLLFTCEAQNSTVRPGTFFHLGPCPRGEFVLGAPRPKHSPAFGRWFTGLYDRTRNGPMARFRRVGIGLHGGGTGLPDPFAPQQGWKRTHGCIRLANASNELLARLVIECQKRGGRAYLTVSGDAS